MRFGGKGVGMGGRQWAMGSGGRGRGRREDPFRPSGTSPGSPGEAEELGFFAEDGDDIFDGDDEEAVVAFEIDGDGVFRVEEDLVVLTDGVVGVVFDECGDGDDAAGDCGDLDFVGEVDAGLGLLFVLVFADEDTVAEGFDGFEF